MNYNRNYNEFKKLIKRFINNIDDRNISNNIFSKIEENIKIFNNFDIMEELKQNKYSRSITSMSRYMDKYQKYIFQFFEDIDGLRPESQRYIKRLNEYTKTSLCCVDTDTIKQIKYFIKSAYTEIEDSINILKNYYYEYISNYMDYEGISNQYKYTWIPSNLIYKLPSNIQNIFYFIKYSDDGIFGTWYDYIYDRYVCDTKWLETVLDLYLYNRNEEYTDDQMYYMMKKASEISLNGKVVDNQDVDSWIINNIILDHCGVYTPVEK